MSMNHRNTWYAQDLEPKVTFRSPTKIFSPLLVMFSVAESQEEGAKTPNAPQHAVGADRVYHLSTIW